ncbi:MAG: ABC transporter permease [Spirochaetes bacterium]|nr:MAG: ABC transporter permease [Spirochaetota bacterium]
MKFTVIIRKEILDQIRDKRTIAAAILLPAIIVPLLLFLTSQTTSGEEFKEPARIIISGDETHLKNMILESFGNTQFIDPESPSKTIAHGNADLHIVTTKSDGKYLSIIIHYDPARRGSALAFVKIENLFKSHFNGPGAAAGNPLITFSAIRSEKENKTLLTLSLLLPVLLMVFAASSTMSSVIDMSSGEKERSTIEILLSCNISHLTIIMGKVLAASVIGLTAIVSLLAGLIVSSQFYPGITGGISLLEYCGITNIALIFIMTFFSIILFSTAGMVIGLYAKSIREGTILTLPVIILCSALSSGLVASDPFTINTLYLLVPVLNLAYLIRSAIFNRHEVLFIIVSISVTMVYSFFLLVISRHLLKNERVIFRS